MQPRKNPAIAPTTSLFPCLLSSRGSVYNRGCCARNERFVTAHCGFADPACRVARPSAYPSANRKLRTHSLPLPNNLLRCNSLAVYRLAIHAIDFHVSSRLALQPPCRYFGRNSCCPCSDTRSYWLCNYRGG